MQKYANSVQDPLGNAIGTASVSIYTDSAHTTLATLYLDNGVTPVANPLTTNSLGEFSFYAADGRYYIVVSKTGITSQSLDDVILFDSTASTSAASINVKQSGTRPTSGTVAAGIWDQCVNVRNSPFLATGDGTTDDTAAINAAIAIAASTGKALFIPAGTYKVTSTLTTIAGQMTVFGEGPFKSIVKFAPAAADTLFYLDNGASKVTHVVMRDLGIYSTDTAYAKVGIDARDLSVCFFERVYIRGTGIASGPGAGAGWGDSSNGSIGIRFQGRESVLIRGVEIVADKPVYFAANPNTSATDGEDCDHFHLQDCYLIANGNPVIEVAAGLGVMNFTIDGYQAWVGGTGGILINDTRVAPTVTSRNISIKNFRYEQATSATGYGISITATQQVQQVMLENGLIDSNIQGIKLNGFVIGTVKNVTTARTTGDSLNATGTEYLRVDGFYPGFGSTFTVSGLGRSLIDAYDATSFGGPQAATYVKTRTGTAIDTDAAFFGSSLCPPSAAAATAARQTAVQIFAGTGAPNNSCGNDGDFYFRGDGTAAGSTIVYHKQSGSWVGAVTS